MYILGESEAEGACWNWWSQNNCDFSDPGCTYWAEWTATDADTVEFKVMAKTDINSNWIAIGFSDSQQMVSIRNEVIDLHFKNCQDN